jgi:hypothetical protein
MGEAWFMSSERKMFDQLVGNLDEISIRELRAPLEELVSGLSSFGALEEWVEWYHYLLGALLPRAHDHWLESLFEYLITGYIGLYPNGVEEAPYKTFREDVLLTLGRCIMDKQGWEGSDIRIGRLLHRSNNNPNEVWCWFDASGDFSSSMFLCLKYVPEDAISGWFKSALNIPSPHWRAQMIVWLVGAHKILHEDAIWPDELKIEQTPNVSWAWSHCLRANMASNPRGALLADKPAFIPRGNRIEALKVLRDELTEDLYLTWLLSMKPYPYLEGEMGGIPSSFETLYLNGVAR